MIARFRDRQVLRQFIVTSVAGLLIGVCWALRVGYPHPSIEAALSLIAAVLCGGPIIYRAVRGLLARQVNVDELVSVAIAAALIIGEYLTAATVAFIMVLGSLLESYTSARARRAIESLVKLVPETARVVDGETEQVVPIDQVRVGQRVLAKPGERVPVDGTVVEGEAAVDQAAVTGEAIPREVTTGDDVFAGSFVHGGALTIETTRIGEDSTLGRIVALIHDAESHQAQIVRSADAFARWFTPAMLTLAGVVWLLSGEFLRCVAVLVVGCPCALILATPTAVVAGMGAAARRGLMIKGGKFLEAAGEVDLVAFDKTGTLTVGQPAVRQVLAFNGANVDQVLSWSAAVEQKSEHPLAEAIVREATRRGLPIGEVREFKSRTGAGVSGLVDDGWMRIGHERHVGQPPSAPEATDGETILWVGRDDRCVGAIALSDAPRDSAAEAVRDLKTLGLPVHLLSGDSKGAVARLAREIEIETWRGELLPHEKVEHLDRLRQSGRRVMYVGDGINDGPALAGSHVGVAMGSAASPLALETAPVAILSPDVSEVPALIRLGRMTRRRIRENLLVFGVAYNGVAILLAGLGILSPIAGAVMHNLGSVAVVLNSTRLLRWKARTARGCER